MATRFYLRVCREHYLREGAGVNPLQLIAVFVGAALVYFGVSFNVKSLEQRNATLLDAQLQLEANNARLSRQAQELTELSEELTEKQSQLADRNEQLKRRASEQERMFGIIAHELRTPAAAIDMAVREHLANTTLIEEPGAASDILSSSSHLLSVIDDLRVSINPEQQMPLHIAPQLRPLAR